jgi:hypothetical protein
MKHKLFNVIIALFVAALFLPVQSNATSHSSTSTNAESPWEFGGYGEMHFNFQDGEGNDAFDFHRLVFFTGYEFASWIRFSSEIEIEHSYVTATDGGELAMEQAYVELLLSKVANVRIGRVLVPVGLTSKLHDPPTILGVERPVLDKYLIPTTWWSDGAGIFGSLGSAARYEAYVLGGLDGSGITAKNGIRGGRVKERPGLNEPAVTGRIDLYPFAGALVSRGQSLKLGLSGYYSGLDNGNKGSNPGIDGNIVLLAGDLSYHFPLADVRAVAAHGVIDGAENIAADVGEEIFGWNTEVGIHVLPRSLKKGKLKRSDLVLFGRYDFVDTQFALQPGATKVAAGERKMWTVGASFYLLPNFVLKADRQIVEDSSNLTNFGVGWQF